MSLFSAGDPQPGDAAGCAAIETVIVPRTHDIGGFEVRRALPSARRRMVGPFIFFDQVGPAELVTGQGIDVRPHPHIGLATVTYLLDGEIFHRDSLGSAVAIRPGDVNWMTAGRGIVHSERTGPEERLRDKSLFGIQTWVALPSHLEETDAGFRHYGRAELPLVQDGGAMVRIIAGDLYGSRAPVKTYSDMFYADAALAAHARLPFPAGQEERAIYVVQGEIEIAGGRFAAGRLLVLRPGDDITLSAVQPSRVLLFGGEPMEGPRYIWWNFVSSSRERIEQAKEDWKQRRFDVVPGDEADYIPLPDK